MNMQQTIPTKTLVKSTAIALIVAALALIMIILPSEYNIDPTGIGTQLGLTALSNPESSNVIGVESKQSSDNYTVIVPAGRGVEFKFAMQKFKKMKYAWQTDGESLYFDLHGEPQGDNTGYFESYAIATLQKMEGSFTTPFAGSHGWYWKNESDSPVSVSLKVDGEYVIIGLKQ
jgi:hypothetical protein